MRIFLNKTFDFQIWGYFGAISGNFESKKGRPHLRITADKGNFVIFV